jgi:hypothetical protein
VRRTVATLLVVASPLLMAAPVGAQEGRVAAPSVGPAAPAVAAVIPTSPVAVAPPATPVAVTPAVPAPATVAAVVRPAVRAVRAKAPAAVSDAAYAAQLQADLCQARAIFCGLDRGGHYPAG